jgi:C4-dicarboxylate transporter DctQ subunit
MKKYVTFCKKINQVMTACGIAVLMAAVILTFVQVVLRNVFQYSFTWAEELTRYLVIYAVYFAAGHVLFINGNSVVDMFYNTLPDPVKKILQVIFHLLITFFVIMMLYYGWQIVARNAKVWCASIRIPWAVPFFSLIVGGVNILLQIPAKIYLAVCGPETDKAQEGGKA